MSADQKHTEEPWEDPFDCDFHATKGPDVLEVHALEHARKCVLALKGLDPSAMWPLVEAAIGCYAEMKLAGYDTNNEALEALTTALAAAKIKKVGE